MEENKKITMLDDNGNKIECEVKMVYLCEENGKSYVFYSDDTYDAEGNLNLYASILVGIDDEGNVQLEEIEDEDEWSLLDGALANAKEGMDD